MQPEYAIECGVSKDMEESAISGDVEYNGDKGMSKRRQGAF